MTNREISAAYSEAILLVGTFLSCPPVPCRTMAFQFSINQLREVVTPDGRERTWMDSRKDKYDSLFSRLGDDHVRRDRVAFCIPGEVCLKLCWFVTDPGLQERSQYLQRGYTVLGLDAVDPPEEHGHHQQYDQSEEHRE
jgi:hypothetical protein